MEVRAIRPLVVVALSWLPRETTADDAVIPVTAFKRSPVPPLTPCEPARVMVEPAVKLSEAPSTMV